MSIKVVTTTGVTYDGELFAVDTVSRSLSLKTTSGAYVILNPAGIQSITGNFSGSKPSDLSKLGLSLQQLEVQEQNSLRQAEKSLESINQRVKPEIQNLYDRLSLIYSSCRWIGESIEILEEYIVDPPYDKVAVLPGKDGTGIERMRKILEGERRKLNL
mmetsp:Transcript_4662/g.5107  ORF Transcript_4662/g.5107 Transcript_4662/m.5107 type:complete len:159 (+) Transcript_4662:125-601(+)|eukprot:gene12239-13383_t